MRLPGLHQSTRGEFPDEDPPALRPSAEKESVDICGDGGGDLLDVALHESVRLSPLPDVDLRLLGLRCDDVIPTASTA